MVTGICCWKCDCVCVADSPDTVVVVSIVPVVASSAFIEATTTSSYIVVVAAASSASSTAATSSTTTIASATPTKAFIVTSLAVSVPLRQPLPPCQSLSYLFFLLFISLVAGFNARLSMC